MKSILFALLLSISQIAHCQNYTGEVKDVSETVKNDQRMFVIVVKVRDDLYRFYTIRRYFVGQLIRVHIEVSLLE